ncbi:hypothetical protein [Photorhabdus laumondii]|uniref:hypothetical protein n=1 Tax=Photorhabdus laumondii TaxID=2218628 RepID=UPI00138AE370|nr:hypothetical protein [Photorhabdus laumondii]NDL50020.1 hypothetical protein [Photorhabdus laumondii subsp. laumondii]
MIGVSECSQQRSNLKDDGYKPYLSLMIYCMHYIPYGFQDASRRQGSAANKEAT